MTFRFRWIEKIWEMVLMCLFYVSYVYHRCKCDFETWNENISIWIKKIKRKIREKNVGIIDRYYFTDKCSVDNKTFFLFNFLIIKTFSAKNWNLHWIYYYYILRKWKMLYLKNTIQYSEKLIFVDLDRRIGNLIF